MIIGDEAVQISVPWTTLSLIFAWVILFVVHQQLPLPMAQDLLVTFSYIPARLLGGHVPMPNSLSPPVWLTPLTATFLQEDWFRLIGNACFAWISGRHVEDSLGRRPYAIFLILVALTACAGDVALHPGAVAPRFGAGALVAGLIGGHIGLFPSARYRSLIYIWFYGWVTYSVPAWLALCFWILIQVALALQGEDASAAGFAVQFAGFAVGIGLALAFRVLGVSVEVVLDSNSWRDGSPVGGVADPAKPLPPITQRGNGDIH